MAELLVTKGINQLSTTAYNSRRLINKSQTLCQHRQLGCQHGTARICCCGAVAAWRPAPAAVDRCLLPAQRSTANPPNAAAAVK